MTLESDNLLLQISKDISAMQEQLKTVATKECVHNAITQHEQSYHISNEGVPVLRRKTAMGLGALVGMAIASIVEILQYFI